MSVWTRRWAGWVLGLAVVTGAGAEPAVGELLGNGDFAAPLSQAVPGSDGVVDTGKSWIFYLNSGATGNATLADGSVLIAPEKIQAPAYGIQLIQSPVTFEQNSEYQLSFDARSTAARSIVIKLGGTAGRSWAAYSGEKKVALTDSLQRYTVSFTMAQPTDPAARVEFWFTDSSQPVWLSHVSLVRTKAGQAKGAPVPGTKTKADEDRLMNWQLLWSDEFDGTSIDAAKWSFEKGNNGGWGNNELEVYTDRPANASVQSVGGSSSLVIRAQKEPVNEGGWTFDYTSARMVTKGKFAMESGKLEIRAQLPRGQGIWPALWLLGDNIDQVGWPGCGEIDLMELLGHEPGTMYSTIHGPVSGGSGVGQPFRLPPGQSFSDDFHLFTFECHPDHLEFLVDGQGFFAIDKARLTSLHGDSEWVYDHPFFLILNVAVGGNWPGNPDGSTVFPQTMAVDFVRVYRNAGAELKSGEMAWIP